MKKLRTTLAISIAIALGAMTGAARAQVTLNVISGGSQNMVDYVTDYLGPLFEKQNPGVKVSVVGTGPDDAGSQKMMEKLQAQKAAGAATWDTDVIVPKEAMVGPANGAFPMLMSGLDTEKVVIEGTQAAPFHCR